MEALTTTPSAKALTNVLLDGFTAAPVCGNTVNCSGNTGQGDVAAAGSVRQQHIAAAGLPPHAAASLLAGLSAFSGATVVPIYSKVGVGTPLQTGGPVGQKASGPGPGGQGPSGQGPSGKGPSGQGPSGKGADAGIGSVMSCAGLRELKVLGQCAPGQVAVVVEAQNLFDDNPRFSTQPIASASSPAVSADFSQLYLQAILVKVNSAATLEQVRTYLVTHATESA